MKFVCVFGGVKCTFFRQKKVLEDVCVRVRVRINFRDASSHTAGVLEAIRLQRFVSAASGH